MDSVIASTRRMRKNDFPVIESMYQEAFGINFPTAGYDKIASDVKTRILQAIDDGRQHIYVVENVDGIILAFIWMELIMDADGSTAFSFQGIGVHSDVRRAGVAEVLASSVKEIAALLGATRLIAKVMPHNEPVVRLIEKLGGLPRFMEYTLDIGGGSNGVRPD